MQSALVIFYAKFSSFGRHHGQLEFQRSAACRTNHARDNLRHQIVPAGQCNELIDIDSARPCPTMRGRRTVPPSTSGNILDTEPFREQGLRVEAVVPSPIWGNRLNGISRNTRICTGHDPMLR